MYFVNNFSTNSKRAKIQSIVNVIQNLFSFIIFRGSYTQGENINDFLNNVNKAFSTHIQTQINKLNFINL